MLKYGTETTKKTYVNHKVVNEVQYKTERVAVRTEANILAEFIKSQRYKAIAFRIIRKDGKIAFIEADYETKE